MEANVNVLKLQRRKVGIVTAVTPFLSTVRGQRKEGARAMALKWNMFGFNIKYFLLVTYQLCHLGKFLNFYELVPTFIKWEQ